MSDSVNWTLNRLRLRDRTSAPTDGFDEVSGSGYNGNGIFYMVNGSVYYKQPDGTEIGPIGTSSVADLADLGDVSVASQTNHYVLASSGGAYAGRLLTLADLPSIGIDDLSDVSVSSPNTNDVLTWNGSAWTASAGGGGGGGGGAITYVQGDDTTGLSSLSGSFSYFGNFTFTLDPDGFDNMSDTDRFEVPTGFGGVYRISALFDVFESAGDGSGSGYNKIQAIIAANAGPTTILTQSGFLDASSTGANECFIFVQQVYTLIVGDYVRFGLRVLDGSDTLDAEMSTFYAEQIA